MKLKHLPRYWPSVRGIHRSPVNSPHKGQWRGALMFSLICASIDGCVNNREAGDLRRHRAHYDVTVMVDLFVVSRTLSHSIKIENKNKLSLFGRVFLINVITQCDQFSSHWSSNVSSGYLRQWPRVTGCIWSIIRRSKYLRILIHYYKLKGLGFVVSGNQRIKNSLRVIWTDIAYLAWGQQ